MMSNALLDASPVTEQTMLSPLLTPTKWSISEEYVAPGDGEALEGVGDVLHVATQGANDPFGELPLLQIKLHRPHVTSELVERPRLYDKLTDGQDTSLTLIAAPAGYGKSTLVGSWLECQNLPGAWLSLEESDNNLVSFLTYLVAAVRTVIPDACPQTAAALANSRFSIQWSAAMLANELDCLPTRMILVLDDVHALDNQAVMQLLTTLVRFPLKGVHLVLIGRKDPFLPLARLRAQGQLTEIRVSDLRFNYEETCAYLQSAVKVDLGPAIIAAIEKQTEGWIAGLRLAALSVASTADADSLLHRIRFGTHHVMDYLAEEVIARQEPAIREYLLMASLVDRFCAPLLDAMAEPSAPPWNGSTFLVWLERADLFVIPLDEEKEWFRFHRLFQQLLRHMVQAHFGSHYIKACHLRISEWFAQQGMINDALHHAMVAGNDFAASQLVEMHLSDVLNREDGPALAQWLAQLPDQLIYRQPVLVLAQAFNLSLQGRFAPILPLLERAEALLEQEPMPHSPVTSSTLIGWIKLLRCQDAYWRGDAASCCVLARETLADAGLEESYVRGNAMLYLALARQRLGEEELAIKQLQSAIAENPGQADGYTNWLQLALACLSHYQGDLTLVIETAGRLVRSASTAQQRIVLGWAHCLLGAAWYQRDQLEVAHHHYGMASQLRNQANPRTVHGSLHGQASICLAQGALDEADELAHMARELADDIASSELIADSRAVMAWLALVHGEVARARQLLPVSDVTTDALALWGVTPSLLHARILLATPTDPLLHEAEAKLDSLLHFAERANNTRQVIATLVLQSRILQALCRPRAGLELLQRAIGFAEPRGFKRIFIDEGPALVPLLQELARKGVALAFVNDLLAAIPEPDATQSAPPKASVCSADLELVEALTYRELDVLELLAQRFSNQEIAEKLVISPATARTHLTNIYQKLQVGSRRQAVLRARQVGILQ